MSTRKVKFKMTLKELSFEFEGDQEIGQRLQHNMQKTLNNLVQNQTQLLPHDSSVLDSEFTPGELNGKVAKGRTNRGRRSRANTPRALIIGLRSEGFFDERREIGSIQDALAKKGHNFKPNELSSALIGLVRKNILKRDQNEGGNYEYERGEVDDDRRSSEDAE